MTNRIHMVVLATNAEGSPDLYATFVEATNLQYNEGQHYDMALARAEDEDYRVPMMAFDQNDAAASMLRYVTDFMEGRTDEALPARVAGKPSAHPGWVPAHQPASAPAPAASIITTSPPTTSP